MAKFVIEYEIHVGDVVRFDNGGEFLQEGIVQDISQIPDIFVEGFEGGVYKRWRRGIGELEILWSEHDEYGSTNSVTIGDKEPVEFVHGGQVGEESFKERIYFDRKRNKICI